MEKAHINFKYVIYFLTFFLTINTLHAQNLQISEVEYEIHGLTREYSLQNKVKIDKNKIFSDEDELKKYIADLEIQMSNTRVFDTVKIDYSILNENFEKNINNTDEINENQKETNVVSLVKLHVYTKDSMHLLVVPYPKYDSNNGFSLRLKAKDTNFFGSMEEMSGDFNFKMEQDDEDSPTDYIMGINFGFYIPFKVGKFNATSRNNVDINYTIGNNTPEWDISSGLSLVLPMNKISMCFDFTQYSKKNLDYDVYGDATYFGEVASFSLPMVIQRIDNWGDITYSPYISTTYYWDFDGIDHNDSDLRSPIITIGQTLSTSRVNWIENFRDGLSVSFTNSYGYNFDKQDFIPGVCGELKLYKTFKYFGLCSDIYAFAYMNNNVNIGSRLRGIRDDQYFTNDYENNKYGGMKACETPAAFIVSIDIPIKLFRIYWETVPLINKIRFAHYFNMEVQISPFVDMALITNRATDTDFYYKDGFYSGGFEVLIFPLKWKGIQVRGSLGIDLGRKMPYVKGKLNQEWRKQVSSYEISIGIGLQY